MLFHAGELSWPDADSRSVSPAEKGHTGALLRSGVLVFVGYYLGARLGSALTFAPCPISVLWPSNSILLAALLLTQPRFWWFLILAAFPAHLIAELESGVPPLMVSCWFVSNCCEALLGAALIRYFLKKPMRFDDLRNVAVFCVSAVALAPILSSFLDAAFVQLNHWGTESYLHVWRVRTGSNVLAAASIAPAIVTCFGRPPASWKRPLPRNLLEGAMLFLALIAISLVVLFRTEARAEPILFYAPLPFLLWIAIRLGSREISAAILIVTLLAIWSSAHGHGPFASGELEERISSIQMFLSVMAIGLLLMASGVEEGRHAEEHFTKAFRASPDAISISRLSDGKLIDVNEQWLKMFRYGRLEVIGRSIFELALDLAPQDRNYLVRNTTNNRTVRDFESKVRIKGGKVLEVAFSAEQLEMAGETCLISIARDITDKKRAEETNRDLAHASRLAVVGELTASIAHEINQPLGAILSNADAARMLLDRESPPLDEIRSILADIRADDLRASEIIRHIRTLTRKREMQVELLDLTHEAFEVMRLVSVEARRRGVTFVTEFTGAPVRVRGDRVHLQQVLMNLILNGIEAMAATPEADRRLRVRTSRKDNGQVRVSVSDSGQGIQPEKLPRLFESFFTTKEDGMGLGLAIARSIVDAHGGRIFAENNVNGGATFWFELPFNGNPATAASSPPAPKARLSI